MMTRAIATLPLFTFFTACASNPPREELSDGEFKVEISRYLSDRAQKTIIIFPPTGGSNFLDRSYARHFQEAGLNVYILEGWTEQNEKHYDIALHERLYARGQRALDRVLTEIKTPYIGVLGTSVGALHAATAASRETRINAVFVIVGGVPHMEVVANSDQGAMRDLKKERFKRFGFKNDREYVEALERNFTLEPLRMGDEFKKKRLGMIIASKDTKVPTKNQERLRDLWKPETVKILKSGHVWAIINSWRYESDTILEFFKK